MRIIMIGAGNVATNMAWALRGAGHEIPQVYSRTMTSAARLAGIIGSEAVSDISAIRDDADAYIISVKDDAIAAVAESLCTRIGDAVVVHTAGSVPVEALSRVAAHCGVLYPMQTFSRDRVVDFSEIPCFIEASDAVTLGRIELLARSISNDVRRMSGTDRQRLHLAAVFACNFANHCYEMASEILSSAGISFDVMLPLIDETARKVHSISPLKAQTGPAVRHDRTVMDAHLRFLDSLSGDDSEAVRQNTMRDIYRLMSRSIHEKSVSGTANGDYMQAENHRDGTAK